MSEQHAVSPNCLDFKVLARPFPEEEIRWRVEPLPMEPHIGRKIAYVDARQVQNRLDEVVTPARWQTTFVEVFSGARLMAVRCRLGIQLDNGTWVYKEDAGAVPQAAAHGEALNLERAYKGAYSDALKRAAVQWGIGRHIHELQGELVRLDDKGEVIGPLVETPLSNSGVPEAVTPPAEAPLPLEPAETPTAMPPAIPEMLAEAAASEAVAPQVGNAAPAVAPEQAAPVAAEPAGARSEYFLKVVDRINKNLSPAVLTSYLNTASAKAGLLPGEHEELTRLIAEKHPATAS